MSRYELFVLIVFLSLSVLSICAFWYAFRTRSLWIGTMGLLGGLSLCAIAEFMFSHDLVGSLLSIALMTLIYSVVFIGMKAHCEQPQRDVKP